MNFEERQLLHERKAKEERDRKCHEYTVMADAYQILMKSKPKKYRQLWIEAKQNKRKWCKCE